MRPVRTAHITFRILAVSESGTAIAASDEEWYEVLIDADGRAGHTLMRAGDEIVIMFNRFPGDPSAQCRAKIKDGCGCDLVLSPLRLSEFPTTQGVKSIAQNNSDATAPKPVVSTPPERLIARARKAPKGSESVWLVPAPDNARQLEQKTGEK